MDADGVDLNLLRVMQAVDQEGSVTLAALRLGMSQPAVSNALARLRRALDDPLFVRSTSGMEATPRARRVVDAMDAALGLIRQGLRDNLEFEPARSSETFDLLMSDLGEIVFLPRLLAEMRRHAPNVTIRTRQLARFSYAEALEAGSADLAIGYVPQARSSPRARRLFSDRFICIVRAGHGVLAEPLTLERYAALAHVSVSRRGSHEGVVNTAFAAVGIDRRVALVLPHFAAAPSVVLASDLALTAPRRLLDAYAGAGLAGAGLAGAGLVGAGLVGIELPISVPGIDLALYWHERLHEDAAHKWLRELFVRLFAASTPNIAYSHK